MLLTEKLAQFVETVDQKTALEIRAHSLASEERIQNLRLQSALSTYGEAIVSAIRNEGFEPSVSEKLVKSFLTLLFAEVCKHRAYKNLQAIQLSDTHAASEDGEFFSLMYLNPDVQMLALEEMKTATPSSRSR